MDHDDDDDGCGVHVSCLFKAGRATVFVLGARCEDAAF